MLFTNLSEALNTLTPIQSLSIMQINYSKLDQHVCMFQLLQEVSELKRKVSGLEIRQSENKRFEVPYYGKFAINHVES